MRRLKRLATIAGLMAVIYLPTHHAVAEAPKQAPKTQPNQKPTQTQTQQPQQQDQQQPKKVVQAPAPIYEGVVEATAYTIYDDDMDGKGITASGVQGTPWVTVAAWKGIPFGSRVVLEDGRTFTVQDRGGAIGYGHLDVLVSSRGQAMDFGRKHLHVKIYAPK